MKTNKNIKWGNLEREFKKSKFFKPGEAFQHPQKILTQFIKFLKHYES